MSSLHRRGVGRQCAAFPPILFPKRSFSGKNVPVVHALRSSPNGTGGVRTLRSRLIRLIPNHAFISNPYRVLSAPPSAPYFDLVVDGIKLPRMALASQNVTLPEIPELYDPNFLDVLLPPKADKDAAMTEASSTAVNTPSHPMMDALNKLSADTADKTYTTKGAQAYSTTGSPTLDAFQLLNSMDTKESFDACLEKAWEQDPMLTLKIIWNYRSIHDGKGDKEIFYNAFGWLLENHPRTAISNLPLLVSPVCTKGKKVEGEEAEGLAHGYWKDLLNILALATLDQLGDPSTPAKFLHSEKQKYTYPNRKAKKEAKKGTDPQENIRLSLEKDQENSRVAKEERAKKFKEAHENLEAKLKKPAYKALYIAIARLFADQLSQDVRALEEFKELKSFDDVDGQTKKSPQLSLVGKWAPTPLCAHDKPTNIATAVALLLRKAQTPNNFPASLDKPDISPHASASILRSFYQRWVLTPLRKAALVPEPLMSGNKWKEIRYNRVSSKCMQNNKSKFFEHDPEGFEKYLTAVESGKKTISGATLWPHELLAEALTVGQSLDYGVAEESEDEDEEPQKKKRKTGGKIGDLKKKLAKQMAEPNMRVIEGQWKTLISRLKESGALENCLAVCDVSGSMGSIHAGAKMPKVLADVSPIWPAVALSLILSSVAKPPFNNGFITFSATPEYVKLDLDKPLHKIANDMVRTAWGMTTNFHSVFVDLLLPLAVKNNLKNEDMIKRLFVFSDMQFDSANHSQHNQGYYGMTTVQQDVLKGSWETNYDAIEKAYKEAGYDVPELVFWDLSKHGTVQTKADRKGVAMLNGLSPALLKVFMGDAEEEEEEETWESVAEDGSGETKAVEKKKEDEFNPENVMKKAVGKKSFEGLKVIDYYCFHKSAESR